VIWLICRKPDARLDPLMPIGASHRGIQVKLEVVLDLEQKGSSSARPALRRVAREDTPTARARFMR